ncbi:MAG: glycerophosphodiester phosphodiesterase family protein [Myxococcota bacterium]
MSWLPTRRTIPVAHRGYSRVAPENTIAAARVAIAAGATHIECDVHGSAEGTPYVIHDPTVDRTTGQSGILAEMRNTEIDGLDAGSWKAPVYRGEAVPRLDAFLAFLGGKGISLALEIKAPRIEAAVLQAVRETAFPLQKLTLFAFDFDVLVRARRMEPQLHLTHLVNATVDEAEWAAAVARAAEHGFSAIGPNEALATERRVESAHAAGLSVFAWTVDEAARMKTLADYGVDAIMTNDIELGVATLNVTG